MRTLIALLSFFLVVPANADSHLESLKKKHPYALLTDDFGILNESDLILSECSGEAAPFLAKDTPYTYWQCFDTRGTRLICSDAGYSEDWEETSAILAIVIPSRPRKTEYLARRAIALSTCAEYRKDWKRLTRDRKQVCVRGGFIDYDRDDHGKDTAYWIFEAFKTRGGCSSYFVGHCKAPQGAKSDCS